MNYEKRYKEALERARDLMTNQNPPAFDKDLISIVFPELAESEDERIRKVLIDYFNEYKKLGTCGSIMFNGIPTDNIIAWLEKQKDVSSIERVFRPIAGCDIADAATQAIEQQQLGYKIVLAFNGAYIRVEEKTTDDIVNEYYSWLEKQGDK